MSQQQIHELLKDAQEWMSIREIADHMDQTETIIWRKVTKMFQFGLLQRRTTHYKAKNMRSVEVLEYKVK